MSYPIASYLSDEGKWHQVMLLSRRTHKARVEHVCDGMTFDGTRYADDRARKCRKPIKPGDRYERQFVLWQEDGSTMQLNRHINCFIEY